MLPNIPLTLKLQNGAITYFINAPSSTTFKELAIKLSEVINVSGGFIKNTKPTPIEEAINNEIDIPKPSFDTNSSDEEQEEGEDIANTTAETDIGPLEGIQIDLESLKFAISKTKKMDLENLLHITNEDVSLQSLNINDYDLILFAISGDEFNVIEPDADRDDV